MKLLKVVLIVITFITVITVISSRVSAQISNGSLEIAPAVTEVTLTSSQSAQIKFTIVNHSDKGVSLELFPVNYRQRGDYGEIGFEKIGIYSFPLASFLNLETDRLELLPGEKRNFTASVQNRDDLSPGGHYVALVARVVSQADSEGTMLQPALSSLILIRKTGGERFNLSLKDSNFPRGMMAFFYPKAITLLFQNEGNVHVVPYGRVEIKDIFGRKLYDGSINQASLRILPSSRRFVSLEMVRSAWSLPLSINTLEIKGHDSLDKVNFILKETFIYINPLVLIILITVITVIAVIKRKDQKANRKTKK